MNILAILAHDKKQSLNRTIFEHITNKLTQEGHKVITLDLYQHIAEIPFYLQENPSESSTNKSFDDYPFVQTCKQDFLAADAIIICAPMYCFSVPAILKCWIDMLERFCFAKTSNSTPRPVHHVKTVLTVITMGMPWLAKILWAGNCIKKYFKLVFGFIGIKNIIVYEITSVEKINDTSIKKHLAALDKKLTHLV